MDKVQLRRYFEEHPNDEFVGVVRFGDLPVSEQDEVRKWVGEMLYEGKLFLDENGQPIKELQLDLERDFDLSKVKDGEEIIVYWSTGPDVIIQGTEKELSEERQVLMVVTSPPEVDTGSNWFKGNRQGGTVWFEFTPSASSGQVWRVVNFDASIVENPDEARQVSFEEVASGALARWLRAASARVQAAEEQRGMERGVEPVFDDLGDGGVRLIWKDVSDGQEKNQEGIWLGELTTLDGKTVPIVAGAFYLEATNAWRIVFGVARKVAIDEGKSDFWYRYYVEMFVDQGHGGFMPRISPIDGEDLGVAGEVWREIARRLGDGDEEEGRKRLIELALEANRSGNLGEWIELLPLPEGGFNIN